MATTSKRSKSADEVALIHGFRSGLEDRIARQLQAMDLPVIFEQFRIPWQLQKDCKYTPDFLLPNGIILESKGRFVTSDRQKHLIISDQYPELDIRFVFSRSQNRISKNSKTTYAKWCETKGFQFADVLIPREWLEEPGCPDSLATVRRLFDEQGKEWPIV